MGCLRVMKPARRCVLTLEKKRAGVLRRRRVAGVVVGGATSGRAARKKRFRLAVGALHASRICAAKRRAVVRCVRRRHRAAGVGKRRRRRLKAMLSCRRRGRMFLGGGTRNLSDARCRCMPCAVLRRMRTASKLAGRCICCRRCWGRLTAPGAHLAKPPYPKHPPCLPPPGDLAPRRTAAGCVAARRAARAGGLGGRRKRRGVAD